MKFLYTVWMWICLSGTGFSATDYVEHEGQQITVTCTHGWASTNRKYFCRDPCNDRDVLVSSDQSPNRRFTLKDFRNGTFTVTISDLQKTDSGLYWCGVDRVGIDSYKKVTLKVYKANTHTPQRPPTPVTKSDTQTSTRRSFPPAPDDITTSFLFTEDPAGTSGPAVQTFFDKAGPLVFTAVGLTVVVIIFGGILCVYKRKNRKSHSSRGPTQTDAGRSTFTTEMAGDYGNITENHQMTDTHSTATVYSAVNQHFAAYQIEDSTLYSNLSIQPFNCSNRANSSIDTAPSVTYAAINMHKRSAPKTLGAEDRVTYDTLIVSEAV